MRQPIKRLIKFTWRFPIQALRNAASICKHMEQWQQPSCQKRLNQLKKTLLHSIQSITQTHFPYAGLKQQEPPPQTQNEKERTQTNQGNHPSGQKDQRRRYAKIINHDNQSRSQKIQGNFWTEVNGVQVEQWVQRGQKQEDPKNTNP